MQKVIVLPKDPITMEELTLEEIEVFRVCICIYLYILYNNDPEDKVLSIFLF